MYLIDTSVWIDFIRGKSNPPVEQLKSLLETPQPVGITSVIYQEILQGAESERHFDQFREFFSRLQFYHPKHPLHSFESAAGLYFSCRRQGITIRSTIDCLIAQIAIEHQLFLLHNDIDFVRIAQVVPQLKLHP